MLKSRSQENRLEVVKQEVGGGGGGSSQREGREECHCVGRVEKDSGVQ